MFKSDLESMSMDKYILELKEQVGRLTTQLHLVLKENAELQHELRKVKEDMSPVVVTQEIYNDIDKYEQQFYIVPETNYDQYITEGLIKKNKIDNI